MGLTYVAHEAILALSQSLFGEEYWLERRGVVDEDAWPLLDDDG